MPIKNNQTKMKKTLALFAIISIIILQTAAQNPDDFSFAKSFKISSPAEIDISTNDGFIHAFGNKSDEIKVFFIVRKNNRVVDMALEELEEHLTVEIQSRGNELTIAVKQRNTDWIRNWKNRYYVSLHILAPTQTACNLKSSDGDIELYGFSGDQICKTSDGNILVEGIEGDLYTRTSDGDIDISSIVGAVELTTSDGDIKAVKIKGESTFKTSDGNIYAGDLEGDVFATTSDGNIILENTLGSNTLRISDGNIIFENMRGSLTAQTSDGDIRGDLSSLTNKLYLKTSDGNISVGVPQGLGMDVRLKGEDIHTNLEDFSGNTSDHLIEGTIRGGGVEVELITSDGDINLNYD